MTGGLGGLAARHPRRQSARVAALRARYGPRATAVWLIHAAAAAACSAFPLVNVLGYERSLIAALLASLTVPWMLLGRLNDDGARAPRPLLAAPEDDTAAPPAPFVAALEWLVVCLVPHAAAGFLVELAQTRCDPGDGLGFLLLLAGGNGLFAAALTAALHPFAGRRTGWTLGLIYLLCLIGIGHGLYTEPQIFVYSVAFGYWPGSLYDEALSVDRTLVLFRVYSSALALLVLSLAEGGRRRRPFQPSLWLRVLALAALSLYLHQRGESEGFRQNRASVRAALSAVESTPHFRIHFDPSFPKTLRVQMAEDHEFRYAQLEEFFGFAPAQLESFVYRDAAQKKRLMGAARTQIAKPWTGEIHIHGAYHPHPVLKHELAHLFSAEIARGPFRVPMRWGVVVNMGLVEGLAVAADNPHDELSLHQWTKAMQTIGLAPAMDGELHAAAFWSLPAARAYTIAGSFVRFLIDRYGMERFKTLYQSNDLALAYEQTPAELFRAWQSQLDQTEISPEAMQRAELRFERGSIFGQACARAAGETARELAQSLAANDLQAARPLTEALRRMRPNDPAPLLRLADAEIKGGHLDRAAAQLAELEAMEGLVAARRLDIEARRGRLAWLSGDTPRARAIFARLAKAPRDAGWRRNQAAQHLALATAPAVQQTVMAYLAGHLGSALATARLAEAAHDHDAPILHYLYGRRLAQLGAAAEALPWLDGAAALPAPFPEEAARVAAQALLATGSATVAETRLLPWTERFPADPASLELLERIRFIGAYRAAHASAAPRE